MRRLLDCPTLLVLLGAAAVVHAQFSDDFGPAPPRFQIPGAVPLGPAPVRRPAARLATRGRQSLPPQPVEDAAPPRFRGRQPGGRSGRPPLVPTPLPSQTSQTLAPQYFSPPPSPLPQRPVSQPDNIPVRPVVEEAEDEYDEDELSFTSPGFSVSTISPFPSSTPPPPPPPSQQPQQRPAQPFRPVFRPEPRPAVLPTPTPEFNYVSPSRQQFRPTAQPEEEDRPRKPIYRIDQAYTSRNKARPTQAPEDEPQSQPQQFSRQPQSQSQPQQFSRQPQPQYNRQQAVVRAPPKPTGFSQGKDGYEKPERNYQRQKKPVAQTLRKYREDNPDGSITWGFENDDGSFKEETIGTDCVTYGKYGYIDPDGTRREYTYSTGIPCDKEKDAQPEASEGYIDYAEMKYVLPNGDSIDLSKMGQKRSRRPARDSASRS